MDQENSFQQNAESRSSRKKKFRDKDRSNNKETGEEKGDGQEIYSKKMWFWHILTPKQNKFIESSVNSNKFLFEMDGTIQPIKYLKINLKTHKSDRIWNASWHSSSNDSSNKQEKEKEKEIDHDRLSTHSQVSLGILESLSNPIEHVSLGRTWSCDRWLFRVNGSIKANRDEDGNNNTSNNKDNSNGNSNNKDNGNNSQKNTPSKRGRGRRWTKNSNTSGPDIVDVSALETVKSDVAEKVMVEKEEIGLNIIEDNIIDDHLVEEPMIDDPIASEKPIDLLTLPTVLDTPLIQPDTLVSTTTTTTTTAIYRNKGEHGFNNDGNNLFHKLFSSANLSFEFVTSTWYKNSIPPFSLKLQNNYSKCLNSSVKLDVQFPHDKDTKALMLGGTYNIQRHFYSGRAYYCWNKKSCIGITTNHHLSNNKQKQKFQTGLHLSWNY